MSINRKHNQSKNLCNVTFSRYYFFVCHKKLSDLAPLIVFRFFFSFFNLSEIRLLFQYYIEKFTLYRFQHNTQNTSKAKWISHLQPDLVLYPLLLFYICCDLNTFNRLTFSINKPQCCISIQLIYNKIMILYKSLSQVLFFLS